VPAYSFGWVPSPPDFRDLRYTTPHAVMAVLPDSVDLLTPTLPAPMEPAMNQQQLGSCGPFSASAHLIYDQIHLLGQGTTPSQLYIYYNARVVMGTVNQDSGVDNRSLLKSLNKSGWCDYDLWTYDGYQSKFKVRPPEACYTQGADRKIDKYLSVPQSLEQMKGCLAEGFPFIFGFTVYDSFMSDAVARTGIVPMPSRSERVRGGHDVMIYGYDDRTQRFKFRNSWSEDWGNNGSGEIPYAYAQSPNLSSDFWTIRGSFGPTPPTPTGGGVVRVDADKKQVTMPKDWTVVQV